MACSSAGWASSLTLGFSCPVDEARSKILLQLNGTRKHSKYGGGNRGLLGFKGLEVRKSATGSRPPSAFVAHAAGTEAYLGDISASLAETGFQYAYLGGLLLLLGGGGFFVIRQILSRRELELAAKELLERVRTGQANPVEYYELGSIMLRKKLYPVARKYLDQAIKKWEDDEQDLAQVYNALGFSYFSEKKYKEAISHYEKALTLSPGYTVAWNNLGSVYEKRKDWKRALKAYEQTLQFDPRNKVALSCQKFVQEKIELYRGIPSKFD